MSGNPNPMIDGVSERIAAIRAQHWEAIRVPFWRRWNLSILVGALVALKAYELWRSRNDR